MALSDADYHEAAATLGLETAVIKAFATVESNGSGMLATGEPKILFERHVFYKRLKAKGINPDLAPPDICSPVTGGYKGGVEEHKRLARAVAIDREAALESASWGSFQIMGYHWKALGYPSLQSFINDMYAGERGQLKAFVKFIQINPNILSALKRKDWVAAAKGYNGPGYAANRYHEKLKQAYEAYA